MSVFGAALPRTNLAATADPTASADVLAGYSTGSRWLNTVSGVWWVCNSAAAGAAVWTPMGAQDHPGYVTGRHYAPICFSSVGAALDANTLYAQLTPILFPCRIGSIGLRINASVASCNGKFALYSPAGQLLVESVVLDMNTAAGGAIVALGSVVPVTPGVHILAACFSGAANVSQWNPGAIQAGGATWFYGTSTPSALATGAGGARLTAALTYAGPGAFFPASVPTLTPGTGTPGGPVLTFGVE